MVEMVLLVLVAMVLLVLMLVLVLVLLVLVLVLVLVLELFVLVLVLVAHISTDRWHCTILLILAEASVCINTCKGTTSVHPQHEHESIHRRLTCRPTRATAHRVEARMYYVWCKPRCELV